MPNLERFKNDMQALAKIGRVPEGGVSRFALSPADIEGRELTMGIMESIGLEVRVDAIGNIRARREGRDPTAPIVMMGSHIDSVPNGGDYDGPTGVMGPLEIVRTLNEEGIETLHPIEVVVFTDEEGARFRKGTLGSAVMAGRIEWDEIKDIKDDNGVTLTEALKGIETTGTTEAIQLREGEVKSFVELHVEQSGRLEENSKPIGIVQAITGSSHKRVKVYGVADHAGATPMDRRTDALVPVARMVQEIERVGRGDPNGSLVCTVGIVQVKPGAMNIVPNEVTFTTDVRDTSPATLDAAIQDIDDMITAVALERGVEFDIENLEYIPAVNMSEEVKSAIASACDKLGLDRMDAYSRAVHDTSHIAQVTNAGMIFVPSVGGKSHSPDELTYWEDILPGLDVLYEVTLALAKAD